MMKKSINSIVCIMFLLIISSSASAKEKPQTFSVSPYAGYYWFDRHQNLNDNPVVGLSLGYNFTKHFGLEASGEYIATIYNQDVAGSHSVNAGNYRLDAIVNLIPDSPVVPFIFGGFGGQSINYPRNVSNRDVATFDYGVGVKFFINDSLAIRLDARQVYVIDGARKDYVAKIGPTFYFGGPEPVAAASEPAPAAAAKEVVIPAPEPKAQEPVIAVAAEPKTVVIALEDLHFEFDESTLTPKAERILIRNIQLLKENPDLQIRIEGYTSASGTVAYNKRLSERRAISVKEYLVNEGQISPERLSTIGYGKSNPAVHETNPKDIYSNAARANMRVIFEIVVK